MRALAFTTADGVQGSIWPSAKEGWFGCIAHCLDAPSAEAAKEAVEEILTLFAKGRRTLIRTEPEGEAMKDFQSGKTFHRGYVRFVFSLEPGEWERAPGIPGLDPSFVEVPA